MAESSYDQEYNGQPIVIVIIILLLFTYATVALRLFVRLWITKVFAADDWLLLFSQVVFTLSCAFLLAGIHHGIGRHNTSLTVPMEIEALKYQALATLSYIANMMFIKVSIALFLLRIAINKIHIWILRISISIVAIWSLAIFIYDIFQCTPVKAQWDYTLENKKCVSGGSFVAAAYSISVMTIVSDWLYALLPIFMIWKVQMTSQAKITVGFILSLGVFASIATIIRLKYLAELGSGPDLLFKGTTAMVWTLVEPGVAIIAASLVTIRPLLRSLNFTGFDSTDKTPNASRPPLHLRSDLIGWTNSTITSNNGLKLSHGNDGAVDRSMMKKGSISGVVGGMRGNHKTSVKETVFAVDGREGSEEWILDQAGLPMSIRRTVDVSVLSERGGRQVGTQPSL